MDNELNTVNKVNLKSIYLIIVAVLVIISLGTYAWLSYRTNDTAMVLTIGDINNVEITLSPYQIVSTASPKSTYTSERYSSVTAINNSSSTKDIRLFYQINSIASELKIDSFKYTITKSTNGSSYSHLKTGNFTTANNGSNMDILSESVPTNTTYYYRVYIWLDSSGGNQTSASGKTLDCELRASIAEDEYVVTLNPNGGLVSSTSKLVKLGETYGTLPTPTREGYTFLGWKNTIYPESNIVSSTKWAANQNVTVTKTSDYVQVIYNQSNSTPGYIIRETNGTFELGKTYTITAYIKGINATSFSVGVFGSSQGLSGVSTSSLTRVSKTFTFTNNNQDFILIYGSTAVNNGFQIKYLQVQEGSVASDYDVTSSTVVTLASNHTLTAMWQAN